MTLYRIPDESDPLPVVELRQHGDELLREARNAAMDALRASVSADHFPKRHKVRDIQRMQEGARDAARAWQKVDALLSGLLIEIEKTGRTLR